MGVLRPARWKQYYSQKSVVLREGSFKWEQLQVQIFLFFYLLFFIFIVLYFVYLFVLQANGDTISKRYQHTGSAVGNDVYFIGGQELPEKRFDEMYLFWFWGGKERKYWVLRAAQNATFRETHRLENANLRKTCFYERHAKNNPSCKLV